MNLICEVVVGLALLLQRNLLIFVPSRQFKKRRDALKREWKALKKLKGEDTGLEWNPIKRTVDASDDWWESRLKVVHEAKIFRTLGIDPKFEGKLNQIFMGIVAIGNKA
ncbi:hypothetical protein J1N35_000984 [Gossypium stocksii]|uniref:Myb/SANT-like domain-containing protein n=1 Tax=Gossypium stocksii TaxID=47602 RepID=A0A9D3WJD6_9ROSI|nr:hypothetical protein J1N35_000984 [Gossypium stocksii]